MKKNFKWPCYRLHQSPPPFIVAGVDCQNKGIMKYLLCSAKLPRAEQFHGLILFKFKRRMKFCRFKVECDDRVSLKNFSDGTFYVVS